MRRLLVPIIALALIALVVFEIFNSVASQTNAIFHTTAQALGPVPAPRESTLSFDSASKGSAGSGPVAPVVRGTTSADTAPGLTYGAGDAPPAVERYTAPAAPTTAAASAPTPAADGYDALHSGTVGSASTYQSPLTAGLVDDNAKFADYLTYLQNYQGAALPVAVAERLFVRVLDNDQHPVAGARVQLFDGARPVFDGRTVSDGRVLFFPQTADATQAQQFRAVISRGQAQAEATIKAGTPEQAVTLPSLQDNSGPVGLDMVFLLDATGSMGDEIGAIKATVDSIASRIQQLPGSSAPRFGLVAYRDQGDDYVTRSWDFGDVQQFAANLGQVQAGGGGDYPEAVNAGLHDAIHLPGWTVADSGRHLRLIIEVGDAPPHLDYPNDYAYTALLQEAVQAGIKIFPIGASGLDAQGEYIFRQFAEITQGQFVFLTYANGVSGAPGPATDMHVSDFSVNNLDSLIVKLVAGEIANQTGQGAQAQTAPPVPVAPPVAAVVAPPAETFATRLAGLARDLGGFLSRWSGALWVVLLLGMMLWGRRMRQAARRAAVPPIAFAVDSPPPASADHTQRLQGNAARVVLDEPAVQTAAQLQSAHRYDVIPVGAVSGNRPTAPLPPLPADGK